MIGTGIRTGGGGLVSFELYEPQQDPKVCGVGVIDGMQLELHRFDSGVSGGVGRHLS